MIYIIGYENATLLNCIKKIMSLRKYYPSIMVVILLYLPSLLFSQSSPVSSYEVQPGAGCTVLIRWETAAIVDTLNYEIERSSDSHNWKVIARERTRSAHKYVVFDTQPVDSLNYYRIKQVGRNNIPAYSQVKCINLVRSLEIYIWPNPSSEVLYVTAPFMSGSMDIFDTGGLQVRKIIIVDFTTSISTTGLAGGVYFLHIRHGDLFTVQRFVKE